MNLPRGGEAEAEGEGEGEGEGSVQVRGALSWAAPAGRKVDEERLRSGSSDQLVELIFGGHHPHVRKGLPSSELTASGHAAKRARRGVPQWRSATGCRRRPGPPRGAHSRPRYMPLTGVWKLSVALRATSPSAPKLLPRRLRLLQDAMVEVPYEEGSTGRWELQSGPADTMCQTVRLSVKRTDASELRLNGLYDGERIAGTISSRHPPADEAAIGEFLCTRLYSFWGTPRPEAARLKEGHADSPPKTAVGDADGHG